MTLYIILNHMVSLLSILTCHLVQKQDVSTQFCNMTRLISATMSASITCGILAWYLFLSLPTFTPGAFILPIVLSIMLTVIHIRWDSKLAPVFVHAILSYPLNLLVSYGAPEVVQGLGLLTTSCLCYAYIIAISMLVNDDLCWIVYYFINNVSNRFVFLDSFISNFRNKNHLVVSAMTGSAFANINMSYLLTLDSESTLLNNFVMTLLVLISLLYISIGLRLLPQSQNIIYDSNFIFELINNMLENHKIILTQLKNNKLPNPSTFVKYYVIVACLSICSTSYASPPGI